MNCVKDQSAYFNTFAPYRGVIENVKNYSKVKHTGLTCYITGTHFSHYIH